MGFTIPNYTQAVANGAGDMAEPDSVDFQILGDGANALVYDPTNYPYNGRVTQQTTASQTVEVDKYKVRINGTYYLGTAQQVNLASGGANPRFDLIVVTTTGLAIRQGSEDSVNPVFPTLNDGDVVLAAIYRPAGGGSASFATTARIIDKRHFIAGNTVWLKTTSPAADTGASNNAQNGDLWIDTTATATGQSMLWIKRSGAWENLAEYIQTTSSNTGNTVVLRDASGNFSAGTITASLIGNASTATSATNAGTVANLSVHTGRNNEANKVVRTDSSGYLQVGYINSSSGNENNASNPPRVWGTNGSDDYLRTYSTSSLSVGSATNATNATNAFNSTYSGAVIAPDGNVRVDGSGISGAMVQGRLYPVIDNAYECGWFQSADYPGIPGSRAWNSVRSYAFTNASDVREKTNIQESNLGLDFIKLLNPVSYKWIVGQNEVTEDGTIVPRPGIREHYGFIAQEVKEALDTVGVEDAAFWQLSNKEDPDSKQSLSLMELISPLVKAVQELSAKVEALEAQIG